jgi:hypothetical protein
MSLDGLSAVSCGGSRTAAERVRCQGPTSDDRGRVREGSADVEIRLPAGASAERGCVGCLGLAVLACVTAALVTAIAWRQAEHENIEERNVTRTLGTESLEESFGSDEAPLELDVERPAGSVILDLS